MALMHDNLTKEEACNLEIKYISEYQGKIYNIAVGGQTGFSMLLKTQAEQLAWKSNLSIARAGRKPALGMKHTDENKEVFSTCGRARWDLYGRYPSEVLNYGFAEANRKFGISKTHYYRLRKASNERLGT